MREETSPTRRTTSRTWAGFKRSFNADSDAIRGISNMALHAVKLFYATEESKEGVRAFAQKRAPQFGKT